MSYRGDDRGRRDRPQWQQRGPDRRGGPPRDNRGGPPRDRGGHAGHKRGREDRPPPNPRKELIEQLMRLGEPKVRRGRVCTARRALHAALQSMAAGLRPAARLPAMAHALPSQKGVHELGVLTTCAGWFASSRTRATPLRTQSCRPSTRCGATLAMACQT